MLGSYKIRTDLAVEARERFTEENVEVRGVEVREEYNEEKEITTVLQHHMFACSLKAFYLAADRLFLFLKLIIFY